jgi:hypothetical protein
VSSCCLSLIGTLTYSAPIPLKTSASVAGGVLAGVARERTGKNALLVFPVIVLVVATVAVPAAISMMPTLFSPGRGEQLHRYNETRP